MRALGARRVPQPPFANLIPPSRTQADAGAARTAVRYDAFAIIRWSSQPWLPAASRRALFFAWVPYDQAVTIHQLDTNPVTHFFRLLARCLIVIGGNHHRGSNEAVVVVIDVEPIFVHLLNGGQRVDLSS
jgi:hypothetical protein